MAFEVFTGSLTREMPQYGAANGQGIGRGTFDGRTGQTGPLSLTGGVDDTAWIVVDPARRVIYSTCEVTGTNQSAVVAYATRPSPQGLRLLSRQHTGGNEACHASLSRDGRFLLVANYNGANPEGYPDGSVTVFPINADGSLGSSTSGVRHEGSGPHPERQRTAHAHCVMQSPVDDMVYVADLGMDRLVAYRLVGGDLVAQPDADFVLPPGLGPRHLVFRADGRGLYLVSELIPTVMSFSRDIATGRLTLLHSLAIQADGGAPVQPAGIVLSAHDRFLFVSLRLSNEILVLQIADDGLLQQVARIPSGGATPRDLALSPDGRHLVVANQDSDRLSVFAVDSQTGVPSGPIAQVAVGTPMSVKMAQFD